MRQKLQGKKREVRQVWKWLAYKDNAMEAKDVDENSQGQPVKGWNGEEPTKRSQLRQNN